MKILVAVIAYNESKNIKKVIEELLNYKSDFNFDIVVIDNSSTDDTAKIAKQCGVDVLSHCINTGGSMGTVSSYFIFACKNDYDILCQFDGDGQHIASELEKIISPIATNEADFVIGSRFLEKEGFQSYFFRRIGIKLFSKINSMIIKRKITDSTSGFRAYGKNIINLFGNKYKREIYDVNQLLLLSYFAGARIKEVPVIMREREFGKSEYNFFNAVAFPMKGLINILGCLLQKKQITKIMSN